MALQGAKLAGGNPANKRVENDFYATNPKAVEKLLLNYSFNGITMLEPCVGQGHISNAVYDFYNNKPQITALDIVDRGCPNVIVQDFLTWETDKKFEIIISNPPYSLAKEFVEKGMKLLTDETRDTVNGQMAMFLKIQFLEGAKRKELFEKYPPKYIYVFRNRMATWNNGEPLDPNGKKWATTMCHAWFIWEKGSTTEPIVRWLD
jgi:hypothetical protein